MKKFLAGISIAIVAALPALAFAASYTQSRTVFNFPFTSTQSGTYDKLTVTNLDYQYVGSPMFINLYENPSQPDPGTLIYTSQSGDVVEDPSNPGTGILTVNINDWTLQNGTAYSFDLGNFNTDGTQLNALTIDFTLKNIVAKYSSAISVPTSTTGLLTANIGGIMADPGLLAIICMAAGIPLAFYVMRELLRTMPKGNRKS
jgi:opacity protein-like surface antigen